MFKKDPNNFGVWRSRGGLTFLFSKEKRTVSKQKLILTDQICILFIAARRSDCFLLSNRHQTLGLARKLQLRQSGYNHERLDRISLANLF